MEENYILNNEPGQLCCSHVLTSPPPPKSIIIIGETPSWHIGVGKKFNWFQKKMMKWCFGWEVKENK